MFGRLLLSKALDILLVLVWMVNFKSSSTETNVGMLILHCVFILFWFVDLACINFLRGFDS